MLKVAQGNDINLCKRLMTWNGTQYVEVQAAEVTNLKVKYGTGTIDSATELTYTAVGSVVSFRLESTQIAQVGRYNIWITGSLAGNDSSINMENAVIVVPFSNASNAQDYVISETQDLGDDIFIPVPLTSAQVETLKVQLQAAIQAANTAKAQYEAALHEIEGVAKEATLTSTRTTLQNAINALQGSDTTATLTAIKTIVSAISSGLTDADKVWLQQQFAAIDLSSITSRLDNSTYGLEAIKDAVDNIDIDTSTLATKATQDAQTTQLTNINAKADATEQALDISSAFSVEYMADNEAANTYATHYTSYIARPIVAVTIDSQTYYLRTDKVYGGVCPEMTANQDDNTFTGYGFTTLYRNNVAINTATTHPASGDVLTTAQVTYTHSIAMTGTASEYQQSDAGTYSVAFQFTNQVATAYSKDDLSTLADAIEGDTLTATGTFTKSDTTTWTIVGVDRWVETGVGSIIALVRSDEEGGGKQGTTGTTATTLTDTVTTNS